MIQYICIEKLTLNKLDENEEIDDNNFFEVETGSLWEKCRGGMGEIRLEGLNENEYEWMEISKEVFKHYFKPLEQIEKAD
ncbi:hypothetical protein [Planococcus faecalis]|uniref:Uncharacterized protein n=1 Tax=Planococcus faecalis TaxID=1598147 RepID=A0ABN4XSI2_9BACL|nr:hypothetical protein [Planococcus faecalis]AQU79754.1 hypothetical protein AJGP001_10965 [Planococcus faecalis]OHX52051.1 hypothetical protein BB777_14055 [Planococcus faecalis]